MRKTLFVFMATVLLLIAQVSAASACLVQWHEPEVPEALK